MEELIEQRGPAHFPRLLGEIPDPPEHIYVRGNLPSDELMHLAVVGSRKYTSYGKAACERLIEGLRGYPVVIVSGLALGMDAIAHEAALRSGLTTLAVPGSGLSERVLYPRNNLNLARRILESGGALLSEFPPEHRARIEDFPRRNRIMAGLSRAVLIIEAAERSGTLITARLAAEYNRDVLAVPGPITSPTSEGPHRLIRDGAALIRSSADILEALGIASAAAEAMRDLSETEHRVLSLLATPLSRDELTASLDLPVHEANILISTMELKGLIVEKLGALYAAAR